ncbi:MAG: IcmT/TraK family protein [Alphaproteobacteria bacterium]|nr:IcmT/TraK family protein [Alphaproteobacteria bacterium SS10]
MAHWRDTMRPMRFFGIDARATIPLLLFIMHAETWTFMLAVGTATLFTFLERKGLTVPAAIRAGRAWIAGEVRPAVPWWERRHHVDYRK